MRCPHCLERIPEDVDGIEVTIKVHGFANKEVDFDICDVCWNHIVDDIICQLESANEPLLKKLKV